MNGFTGKILNVDLTNGTLDDQKLNAEYASKYIGGSGLGARYLYDLTTTTTNPLGPENPLMFFTGPLTGTPLPSCGRYAVCARSPLTGIWGEANSGGRFGPMLKFAGYDGLIITGQAAEPVYIEIINGKLSIKPAKDLWGMDCYETQTNLKERTGQPRASVACIGAAGENMAKVAGIMNDAGRLAARTGLGAVMGSKKLKAIITYGEQKVTMAERQTSQDLTRDAHAFLKEDITAEMFRLGGTAFYMDIGMMYGDIPVKYFTEGDFDVSALNSSALSDTILAGSDGCYRCPISCGRKVKLEKYGIQAADGPEYETIAAFGPLLKINDLAGIAYAGHLCNRHGLDTISTGSTLALLCSLTEKGLLEGNGLTALRLKWGDIESVNRLIELTALRQGVGDWLADGSVALNQRLGIEDGAMHVKGLEMAMHDPRAFSGMGLAYATAPRGACHLESDYYLAEMGVESPEVGIHSSPRDKWADSGLQKVQSVVKHQDWRSISDALIMCKFTTFPIDTVCAMLNAVTGEVLSAAEIMRTGERIFNLKRLLNLRFGLRPGDDRLPESLSLPLNEGGAQGNAPDFSWMIEKYYEIRGWDKTTGNVDSDKRACLELP